MKQWIKRLYSIIFAVLLVAICVNMFLAPHQIAAGGVTGLAIILEAWFSFGRSTVTLIANALLLIAVFVFLGKEMFFNTVIGSIFLPIFIAIVPDIKLVDDAMLSMIAGSVLMGVSITILFKNKASSGGTSIPPLIFQKYFGLNPSIGLLITDGIIVLLCLFVFSVDAFLYALLSIFITSTTMNYIETGLNKKKLVYIISDMHEAIMHDVINKVQKGVTIVPIIGAYRKREMPMLMVTLDSKKYRELKAIVSGHDADAFMITDTVSDVHGEGFSYEWGTV